MTAGGYFGQALVVDATTADERGPAAADGVLRAYLGGAGLGAWLLHQLGRRARTPWTRRRRWPSCSPRWSARR